MAEHTPRPGVTWEQQLQQVEQHVQPGKPLPAPNRAARRALARQLEGGIVPSASAAARLRAFRAVQQRADLAEQAVKRLTAELAALTASSDRQITRLRAEIDRLRAGTRECMNCEGSGIACSWCHGTGRADT